MTDSPPPSQLRPRRVHAWFVLLLALIALLSLLAWLRTREPRVERVRIATALAGGLYDELGRALAQHLSAQHPDWKVEVIETRGSVENVELLTGGGADLAVVQASSIPSARHALRVLAPLHPEAVHVVARKDLGATDVVDLLGRRVALGPVGSGMRASALRVLEHLELESDEFDGSEAVFTVLRDDPSYDAAIVTTGTENESLRALLATGDFALVPLLEAGAIEFRDVLFERITLPRGLFGTRPMVPAVDVETVASTAVLATSDEAPRALVGAALDALYGANLRAICPNLVPRDEALERAPGTVHSSARAYLDPYGDLDRLSGVIEAVSGLKELFVGALAAAWLLFDSVRRLERRERERVLQSQKDRLDEYLLRTVAIEREQARTEDPDALIGLLDQVTEVKLSAIDELADEGLRGDQVFQIFLTQCANLSRKIESRIALL